MLRKNSNSRLLHSSRECWLDCLVSKGKFCKGKFCEETFCPRRYRANLPSRLRPNLFGSD